jgi:Domain of unknown function (DUF4352)
MTITIPRSLQRQWWFLVSMGTIAFVATFLFASLLIRDPVHPAPVVAPPVPELVAPPESEEPEETKKPEPPKPVEREPFAAAVTVRDDDMVYTVTAIKSAVPKVGTSFMEKEAKGSYTLLEVKIENLGKRRELFIPAYALGRDSRYHEVPADVSATIAVNFGNDQWLRTIKPGQTIGMSIVFDVADGATLESVLFRSSVFSNGTKVLL